MLVFFFQTFLVTLLFFYYAGLRIVNICSQCLYDRARVCARVSAYIIDLLGFVLFHI